MTLSHTSSTKLHREKEITAELPEHNTVAACLITCIYSCSVSCGGQNPNTCCITKQEFPSPAAAFHYGGS